MIEQLAILLSEADVKYKRKCSLKDISPIRIGGECELVVFPDTKEKLRNTVRLLRDFKAKYKTVGRMSNILVSDVGYSGVLVRCDAFSSLEICGDDLTAECGLTLPSLAKLAAGASLSGLEEISGIPGTLGGAICSNAGAFGREISDVISSVDCLDPLSGELIRLGKNELSFSYRYSSLRESDLIILSATLSLKKTDHSVCVL